MSKVKLPLFDVNGKSSGEVAAAEKIFGAKQNDQLVQSALVWFQAAQRRGTHSTKTRAEVSGGGKKPWKQKGTGRARHGSIRSPIWRKGGVTFGPKPRDYNYAFPIKMRKGALRVALSDMAAAERIKVVDQFQLSEAKTKQAAKLLKDLKVEGKVLLVMGQANEPFLRAARNLAKTSVVEFKQLNIFDLLNADWVIMEKAAVTGLEEKLN
ncbi:MAG: 50S ribosomal protein L4 [Candidatus Saganbacteria bacterium]|nr:50S ribosomal protein L4 [Candidatus Saganbacteria bacterium]